jgi:hypothetical protein
MGLMSGSKKGQIEMSQSYRHHRHSPNELVRTQERKEMGAKFEVRSLKLGRVGQGEVLDRECLMLVRRSKTSAVKPQLYPHLSILLPSPCTRGEGQGGEGFCTVF